MSVALCRYYVDLLHAVIAIFSRFTRVSLIDHYSFSFIPFSSECGFEKVYDQGLDDDMAKWLWNISEKWTKLSSKSE